VEVVVRSIESRIADAASPLRDAKDLEPLFDRIGDARFVLLGAASHGTSEYYRWRSAVTRHLFASLGFSTMAVEGDWPDCHRVTRWLRGEAPGADAEDVLRTFERWPTWMWANQEIAELVDELAAHRASTGGEVGFYGLDVYSLWDSLAQVGAYLRDQAPEALQTALEAFECFDSAGRDMDEYASLAGWLRPSCEAEVVRLLTDVRRQAAMLATEADRLDLEQNAVVIRDAERYYRAMVHGGSASWNVRDEHMVDTLERIAEHHGRRSRAVVWAHNTHIGDARFTDMARAGLINLGQRMRERHADEGVVAVGFGSYQGSVIASSRWGAPAKRMSVPPARPGSWEDLCHRALGEDALILLGDLEDEELWRPVGQRAIGVVYDPEDEGGNYVPTIVPSRYDAFVYLDRTRALHPLHEIEPAEEPREAPETFPSGL